MSFITIGPNISMTPRHREVNFSVTADYNGFATISSATPGINFSSTVISLIAGVAVNVSGSVINSGGKVYTITVTDTTDALITDSCTVTVESVYTSFDLSTVKDTVATALEALRPSYEPDNTFDRSTVTYHEYGIVSVAESRGFYLDTVSLDDGTSPNIHKFSFQITIGYSYKVYETDMVEIRNHLNNYDWPSGIIMAWCPSVVRSELNEEQASLVATIDMEIFS